MDIVQNQRFKGKTPTDTTADQLTAAFFGRTVQTAPEIICGTTKYIFEKTALKIGAQGDYWTPATRFDSVGQLAEHLKSGFAICTGALSGTRRQGCDVTAIHLLGTDFDGLSVEQILEYRLVMDYAAIVYPTASSTPDAPRSRALFILDTAITPAQFRLFIRRLLAIFEQDADLQCSDPARIWYGSTNPKYLVREGVILPVSVLAALPDPPAAASEAPLTTNNGAPPSVESLINHYLTYQSGRNTALFTTLTYARDYGITSDADAIQQLKRVFANERPRSYSNEAGYESIERREREFNATLASVYKRAPRAMPMLTPAVMLNAIREALLQQKQDAAARLLDMLYSAGIEPGNAMTEKQIVELCAAKGISRKTIRKALETNARRIDLDTGEIIENRVFVPILYTPQSGAIAKAKTTCVVRCQNGDKNLNEAKSKGGRPSGTGKQYAIPTVDYMLDLLGIERENAKHADAIPADAVKTASSYRRAIHTALVKRTPEKQYSMRLLTQRLGVTRMTVYSYNKAAGIEAIPVYTRIPITWENVNSLPFVDIADADQNQQGRRFVRGMFIADVTNTDPAEIGEKHSPFAVIARRLLSERRTIYLCYQEANAWVYKPAIKRSAPIFKLQTVTPAAQPVPLAKAAGAESMTPPPTSQWGHTPDDNGVSRLNPFSRKGHTRHDPDADDPPA